MSDTSIRVDENTRDRLQSLAAARGMSVRAYLHALAVEQENQTNLNAATEAFRAAVGRPGIAEAFDREFGGSRATSADAARPGRRAA